MYTSEKTGEFRIAVLNPSRLSLSFCGLSICFASEVGLIFFISGLSNKPYFNDTLISNLKLSVDLVKPK